MSLWFIVPAHGRVALSELCFTQLAHVCDELEAEALVIAEDENLEAAYRLFDVLERPNSDGLGKRFNDGFQYAAENGADYVVPLGSDDWVHPDLFKDLPDERTVACFQFCSLVSETGRDLARLRIPYAGGIGIRIMPTKLLAEVGYRPARDTIERGVDTSTLSGLHSASNKRLRAGKSQARLEYRDSHPLQIVDFKTPGGNLNSFKSCDEYRIGGSKTPFEDLAEFYPADAVDRMADHYGVLV